MNSRESIGIRTGKKDGGDQALPTRRVLSAWMLGVTRPVLGALIASTLCRIADQMLVIGLYAFAMYEVVATALKLPQAMSLGAIALTMIGMALAKGLLRYGEQFFGHYVAFKALELLRRDVYENLVPQAPAMMSEADSGDLLSRITSDIDRIEVFFAHTIAPAISAIVIPVGLVCVLAFATTPAMAIAAGIVLAAALAIIPTIGNGEGMAAARQVAAGKGRLMQHVSDSLQGMTEIIGYDAGDKRLEQQESIDGDVAASGRGYRLLLASRRALSHMLMLVGASAVFIVGIHNIIVGGASLTLAGLAAATISMIRVWEVIVGVEGFATYLANSFASASRIHRIAHRPPTVMPTGAQLDAENEAPIALAWDNVTFTYPQARGRTSSRPALDNVTIHAKRGKWTCILGATGSGKSTLTALAERYWDPDSGSVSIYGQDLRDIAPASLRRHVAVVSQRSHIFAASVADNLRLADPQATDEQLWQALHLACIDELVKRLPKGLHTMIGSGGQGLSGGQIQRLSLAQAYLMGADMMILDEFTAHLDPALARMVRQRLRAHLPDVTIVEITHGLDMVMDADHIAVIDSGRVVEQGTPRVLAERPDSALSQLLARA